MQTHGREDYSVTTQQTSDAELPPHGKTTAASSAKPNRLAFQRVDDQFWPLVVAMVVLGGFLAGSVLAYLRLDDPRWYANAWTWLIAIPLVIAAALICPGLDRQSAPAPHDAAVGRAGCDHPRHPVHRRGRNRRVPSRVGRVLASADERPQHADRENARLHGLAT